MSATQNPRSDSKLKRLPPERQLAIVEMLKAPGMSQKQVRKELEKDGLATSEPALSEFFSWWHMKQRWDRLEDFSDQMTSLLKEQQPELSDQQLEAFGNRVFQKRAIEMEEEDPEAASMIWYRLQRLNLKKADQALFERRIKLLEAKAAQADKAEAVLKQDALTPEQISDKMKNIFGITK